MKYTKITCSLKSTFNWASCVCFSSVGCFVSVFYAKPHYPSVLFTHEKKEEKGL